jgi:hypothetical protein
VHLGNYAALAVRSQRQLADAFSDVAAHHRDEPDVSDICLLFEAECRAAADGTEAAAQRYTGAANAEPERLHRELFSGVRSGGLGLLRDLHDLYLLASECTLAWTVIDQAAQALRDAPLHAHGAECLTRHQRQLSWLMSRIKQEAPQSLIAARD